MHDAEWRRDGVTSRHSARQTYLSLSLGYHIGHLYVAIATRCLATEYSYMLYRSAHWRDNMTVNLPRAAEYSTRVFSMGQIYKISCDYLAIMPELRSTLLDMLRHLQNRQTVWENPNYPSVFQRQSFIAYHKTLSYSLILVSKFITILFINRKIFCESGPWSCSLHGFTGRAFTSSVFNSWTVWVRWISS